jgi:hypothetical protein
MPILISGLCGKEDWLAAETIFNVAAAKEGGTNGKTATQARSASRGCAGYTSLTKSW